MQAGGENSAHVRRDIAGNDREFGVRQRELAERRPPFRGVRFAPAAASDP